MPRHCLCLSTDDWRNRKTCCPSDPWCLDDTFAARGATQFLGSKGKTKGTLMMIHKSTAVILGALIVPRLALRLTSSIPAALPGSYPEHIAANASHAALYAFMLGMPATGFAMGYYGRAAPLQSRLLSSPSRVARVLPGPATLPCISYLTAMPLWRWALTAATCAGRDLSLVCNIHSTTRESRVGPLGLHRIACGFPLRSP